MGKGKKKGGKGGGGKGAGDDGPSAGTSTTETQPTTSQGQKVRVDPGGGGDAARVQPVVPEVQPVSSGGGKGKGRGREAAGAGGDTRGIGKEQQIPQVGSESHQLSRPQQQQPGGPWRKERHEKGPQQQQPSSQVQQPGGPTQQQPRDPSQQQQKPSGPQQQQPGHPKQQAWGPKQQASGPRQQPSGPHQQQPGGPQQQQPGYQRQEPHEQQRGPQQQSQWSPQHQSQWGPTHQQPRGPHQQQPRGPQQQQPGYQREEPHEQQRGPQQQSQWGPQQQSQWGPTQQQPRGPHQQQPRGPQQQQPSYQRQEPHEQQRGPQQHSQWGPTQQQPRGPHQQQWGPSQQQQPGPQTQQPHQQQRGKQQQPRDPKQQQLGSPQQQPPWGQSQQQPSGFQQQQPSGPQQQQAHGPQPHQQVRGPPQQPPKGPEQTKSGDRTRQQPRDPQQQRGSPQHSGSPMSTKSSTKSEAGDQSLQKYTPVSILSLADQLKEMKILQTKKIVPGTKGRKITIETNHIHLDLGKLRTAFHYDVQIDPETPKKFLRDVMELFRQKHFPRNHPAFDGRKNMYSPVKLMEEGQALTDEITVIDRVNEREKVFKVQVKFANTVDLTPLHKVDMTLLSPQEAIQCVEIVLRSAPSNRCIQAGRNFFTRPARIIELGEGMEMYHGFYQSVIRGWKPLVNIDVAHKAFPKETDIIGLIIELFSTYNYRMSEQDLRNNSLRDFQIQTLTKFLRTLRVLYEIRGQPGSRREYRVNGVRGCPREVRFRPDNGPEVTIEEYFLRKKNYRLQFPLMPTLWVGNIQRPDPILLPAELCTIIPGQPVNRKMTENQTSNMIKTAATSTTVRKQKIMGSLNETRHNEDLCVREFGFRLGKEFEKVQARVLDPPMLEYSGQASARVSKGVWRNDNLRFLRAASIKSWTVVSFCGPVDASRLADGIFSFAGKCGMVLASRAVEPFQVIRSRQPSVKEIMTCLTKCAKDGHDLVFVIIPDSGPTYSDVKKAAELNIGCLTQCIKRRTMAKLTPPTINNILLKVNSKLNGTNHCLRQRPPILSKPCMIMGADVTHPSPDSQNIPSVAAVTASHDPMAFCYNICCRLQSPKAEIITDLQEITKEHLLYFYRKNNGQKPYTIVCFRDGVSEGQFIEVLKQEVRAIRNACASLQDGYNPSITFLVVQKRHHTRFFPINQRDSDDRNFNVPAGTCVDTNITNPMMQDFYLVSHASIQGVAKPTKYCTLWDDNNLSNDDIEELTYHLCHLFSRCNRSVSYPAPTYYAHLAAARAKVYIENDTLDLRNLGREQAKIQILDSIRKDKPMFFV